MFEILEKYYLDSMYNKNCSLIFVYNHIDDTSIDNIHKSECVYPEEINQITESFRQIPFIEIIPCESEQTFIDLIPSLKKSCREIYVYSMAQNVEREGRRCLIPLLCDYYAFTNISGSFKDSFISGNKKLMFNLLRDSRIETPSKIYVTKENIDSFCSDVFLNKRVIIKPFCESASIGIDVLEIRPNNVESFKKLLRKKIDQYRIIIIEEFVIGDEVECTVIKSQNEYIKLPVIKIEKSTEFLDYDTVKLNLYNYSIYKYKIEEIQRISKLIFDTLDFDVIGRFDFIIDQNKNILLFDITANPTISEYSSTNCACVNFFSGDSSTIYKLLFFISFYSNHRSHTE